MITYCFKWNYADGAPGELLTMDEARSRDDAGEEYTALLSTTGSSSFPTLVTLAWKTGVVVVTFLDLFGRKTAEYTFRKKTTESLFLRRVHLWTYPNDQPGLRLADSTSHETVYYQEDGSVKRVVKNKIKQTQETIEYTNVPVDANWEPIPQFGDYHSIARYERGIT